MAHVKEGPERTTHPIRTRRVIVPGVYGPIEVGGVKDGHIEIGGRFTAEELREAAHILNQIAEVLEENGE